MCSRRSRIFTEILAFILLMVLAGTCLPSGREIFISSRSQEAFSTQEDTMQKLCIGDIAKIEILDNFGETLCDNENEEEAALSRLSIRFFLPFFLYLLAAGLFNVFIRNFLSTLMCSCMFHTVIINYIHKVDGKIKY